MNRASLLHILDHASGISEAEVRELEQLAAAFPYCQTAHLLLAKAAHDRGSMLAGQRLRRAATYAADRELLRVLIEQPAAADRVSVSSVAEVDAVAASYSPAAALAPTAPAAHLVDHPTEVELLAATGEPEAHEAAVELPAAAAVAALREDSVAATDDGSAGTVTAETALPAAETLSAEAVSPADEPVAVETAAASQSKAATDMPAAGTEELAAADTAATAETSVDEARREESSGFTPTDKQQEVAVSESGVEMTATDGQSELEASAPKTDDSTEPALAGGPTTEATTEQAGLGAASQLPVALLSAPDHATADELPPAAPPIRPPVEAGSSRFEFGLGDAPEPGPAYQLPELPEKPAPGTIPPYRADELLAYALSSGSRFGAALTLRDAELTHDLPTSDAWHPDAALLAHAAAHRPAAPAAPSSLALIDKFLRSQPRIKTAQRPAPTDSPQADLSVRSTSAAPSLASESLAKIMVRQGKIGRAVEIYEQLMQRQPEKKAYFAAQIDLLNQQPE